MNTPPTVDLTAPAAGASYIQGTAINLTADASDVDGTVSRVEFYRDNILIGADSSAPYTFVWNNAAVGGYAIYAKAVDNGGASSWSDSAHIAVTNAPAYMRNWTLTGNNMSNTNSGYVTIGGPITQLPSDTAIKLAVKGTIFARKLTVTQTLWADYVFDENYRLRSLSSVEAFINRYHHLPEVPSATDVNQHGVNVGDSQALLLKKVEELTLYVIQLNKRIDKLEKRKMHVKHVSVHK